MTNRTSTGEPFPDISALFPSSTPDLEVARGRKRDRSPMRSDMKKTMRPDESSTLRGRSRHRASSPLPGHTSRNSSSSLRSPTKKHMLLHVQLRDSRREHCPSRGGSPTRQRVFRRRQRTRSRSRGPPPELEIHALSSLRNELLRESDDNEKRRAE